MCELTSHDWTEEYNGYRCKNCGEFIPYGCEPWLPVDDFAESELTNDEMDDCNEE